MVAGTMSKRLQGYWDNQQANKRKLLELYGPKGHNVAPPHRALDALATYTIRQQQAEKGIH
jgi:hypothetical protein